MADSTGDEDRRTIHKDAANGRFVSEEEATARPRETYATTVPTGAAPEADTPEAYRPKVAVRADLLEPGTPFSLYGLAGHPQDSAFTLGGSAEERNLKAKSPGNPSIPLVNEAVVFVEEGTPLTNGTKAAPHDRPVRARGADNPRLARNLYPEAYPRPSLCPTARELYGLYRMKLLGGPWSATWGELSERERGGWEFVASELDRTIFGGFAVPYRMDEEDAPEASGDTDPGTDAS